MKARHLPSDRDITSARESAALLLPYTSISKIVGVKRDMFNLWRKTGESLFVSGDEESPEARFFLGIEEGFAEAYKNINTSIMRACTNGNWMAGKYLIESHPSLRKQAHPKMVEDEAISILVSAVVDGDNEVMKRLKKELEKAKA